MPVCTYVRGVFSSRRPDGDIMELSTLEVWNAVSLPVFMEFVHDLDRLALRGYTACGAGLSDSPFSFRLKR